jgi:hypothetical protein
MILALLVPPACLLLVLVLAHWEAAVLGEPTTPITHPNLTREQPAEPAPVRSAPACPAIGTARLTRR